MKKYNVTLDEKAVEKVKKVLKLSGMKLSNYLNNYLTTEIYLATYDA